MMVLALGVLADAAHCVDAVEERRELHGAAQRAVGVLPAVEIGDGGIHLFIG